MSTNQYVIKSAHRTLEVLLAFGQSPHRFGLADLQQVTKLEKNQLYRSLKTLEAAGYLEADSAGRYAVTGLVHSLVERQPTAPARAGEGFSPARGEGSSPGRGEERPRGARSKALPTN